MEMIHGMRSQVLAQLRGAGFVRARGPGDIRCVRGCVGDEGEVSEVCGVQESVDE